MNNIILYFITFNILFSGCCSYDFEEKDFQFTKTENQLISNYSINDTLYFISNKGDQDTITILNVSEFYERGSTCGTSTLPVHSHVITIEHLPIDNWAGTCWNCGEDGGKKTTYQSLIAVLKFPTSKLTEVSFSYRDFYALLNFNNQKFDSFKINEVVFNNCLKIKCTREESNIRIVYWSLENGLVGYENHLGETWTLVQ